MCWEKTGSVIWGAMGDKVGTGDQCQVGEGLECKAKAFELYSKGLELALGKSSLVFQEQRTQRFLLVL